MKIDTLSVKKNILSQRSARALVDYVNSNQEYFVDWQRYINEVVALYGHSYEKFAHATGINKSTVRSWCVKGNIPRTRDAFIKLAFGLKMNIDETNELLSTYGKYSALYAKDTYDAIVIYVINKRTGDWNNENYTYEALSKWVNKFKNIKTNTSNNQTPLYSPKTMGVYNSILDAKDDENFELFLIDNKDVFLTSYTRLITYIDDFINIRKYELEDLFNDDISMKYSWHKIVQEKNMNNVFEKMLSELKNHGILPSRKQLIALGIHLNMTSADIDRMLSLAHMKKLYAKDKVESLLLYFLRNAAELDPDIELNNAYKYLAMSSSREFINEYKQVIDRYIGKSDIPEWEECIEDLAEYIRNQLLEQDMADYIDHIF